MGADQLFPFGDSGQMVAVLGQNYFIRTAGNILSYAVSG